MTDFERLKFVRKKTGMNQDEFANTLDITQSSYSRLENGSRSPSFDFLKNMSIKHSISLDWLVFGKGDMLIGNIKKVQLPEHETTENTPKNVHLDVHSDVHFKDKTAKNANLNANPDANLEVKTAKKGKEYEPLGLNHPHEDHSKIRKKGSILEEIGAAIAEDVEKGLDPEELEIQYIRRVHELDALKKEMKQKDALLKEKDALIKSLSGQVELLKELFHNSKKDLKECQESKKE